MSTSASPTTGSSRAQSELWGARALDWAHGMEVQMRPVFEAVLDRISVGQGTELLDAGCGSGLAAQIAAGRGAVVTGFDATRQLLAIARERVPNGEFVQGDLESLAFADNAFDAVVGFNSFQYAGSAGRGSPCGPAIVSGRYRDRFERRDGRRRFVERRVRTGLVGDTTGHLGTATDRPVVEPE